MAEVHCVSKSNLILDYNQDPKHGSFNSVSKLKSILKVPDEPNRTKKSNPIAIIDSSPKPTSKIAKYLPIGDQQPLVKKQ